MSRIVTNTSANSVFKNYSRNQSALASSMEKLSTGLRINRASDDAAGLAISETLRGEIKGTDSAVDVLANATNFINTADGYMQSVNDMLGRMEELSTSMLDGTKTSTDKANLASEFNALRSEISGLNTGAQFNGGAIFGASKDFASDASGTTFTVKGAAAGDGLNSLTAIANGITALAGSDAVSTITAQITAVKSAITTVATQRADLGADQSRLNFRSMSLENYSENASAAESRIRNVDVAKESTNFAKNQILVQASTAMLSQANSNSQNVLSLLR
jgi:flagellin